MPYYLKENSVIKSMFKSKLKTIAFINEVPFVRDYPDEFEFSPSKDIYIKGMQSLTQQAKAKRNDGY